MTRRPRSVLIDHPVDPELALEIARANGAPRGSRKAAQAGLVAFMAKRLRREHRQARRAEAGK